MRATLTTLILLAPLMSAGCQALQPAAAPPPPIEVVGDERFTCQVNDALRLLAERAPEDLAVIRRYVGRIKHAQRSGMRAYDRPPTYDMSDRTAYHSLTWCAGTIAHDAYHSKLYHEYLDAHGGPVPPHIWTGQTAEQRCNAFQLQVLRKIGAPQHEVEYMQSQDGSHSDVNSDGVIDERDYILRNW